MTSLVVWSILSTILATLGVGSLFSIAISLWSLVSAQDHIAFCLEQWRQWTEIDRDNRTIDDIPYGSPPIDVKPQNPL